MRLVFRQNARRLLPLFVILFSALLFLLTDGFAFFQLADCFWALPILVVLPFVVLVVRSDPLPPPGRTRVTEPTVVRAPPRPIPRLAQWRRYMKDRFSAWKHRRSADGFRNAPKVRRCIHCGYALTGLPAYHTCPECGRDYSFPRIDAYIEDPKAFRCDPRHTEP